MIRENFNNDWVYYQAGDWWRKPVKKPVSLPHDFGFESARIENAPGKNNTGYFPGGIVYYEKVLFAPRHWKDKTVIIEFEGIYMDAVIKCNGNVVAKQTYGYTTFHCILHKCLKYGQDNLIEVKAVNNTDNSRWYAGTGIYRPAWLMVAEKTHIAPWGLFVYAKHIDEKTAIIQVETEITNLNDAKHPLELVFDIKDGEGNVVIKEHRVLADADTFEGQNIVTQIRLSDPKHWDIKTPHLYHLKASLYSKGNLLDYGHTTFGLRTISVCADQGFLLNGRPLKLRGGCIHHDNGVLGAASYPRAEERKVLLLKAQGFNAVRCAHNPPSPSFLEACDRHGLLVIDEIFDCWVEGKTANHYHTYFEQWWERDFRAMLLRDRNHPSIIAWSTGNEIIERGGKSDGYAWSQKLAAFARSIDPSRFITNALNNISGDVEGLDANVADSSAQDEFGSKTAPFLQPLDIAGYNYFYSRYENDRQRYPGRVICGMESFPMKAFDNWVIIDRVSHVIGDFVWTAIDYFGEAGLGHVWYDGRNDFLGTYPWHMANCGDIDICGFKRPQSYYRDALWHVSPTPYIAVFDPTKDISKAAISHWGWPDVLSCWDYPGKEGELMQVEVYCSCDEVALWLNGIEVGRKACGESNRYKASFLVKYEPGIIKATGHNVHGDIVGEYQLGTAGNPYRLKLTADRKHLLSGDLPDICYLTVEATDKEGNLAQCMQGEVTIDLQGCGELVAFGNSNPLSEEMYNLDKHSLYRGRGMAVVRHKIPLEGIITVTASGQELEPAVILLDAKMAQQQD